MLKFQSKEKAMEDFCYKTFYLGDSFPINEPYRALVFLDDDNDFREFIMYKDEDGIVLYFPHLLKKCPN